MVQLEPACQLTPAAGWTAARVEAAEAEAMETTAVCAAAYQSTFMLRFSTINLSGSMVLPVLDRKGAASMVLADPFTSAFLLPIVSTMVLLPKTTVAFFWDASQFTVPASPISALIGR